MKKRLAILLAVAGLGTAFAVSAQPALACGISTSPLQHCYSYASTNVSNIGASVTMNTGCLYLSNLYDPAELVSNDMWVVGSNGGWVEAGLWFVYPGNNDFITADAGVNGGGYTEDPAYPYANFSLQTNYSDAIEEDGGYGGYPNYWAVNDGPLAYTWTNSSITAPAVQIQGGLEVSVNNGVGDYALANETLSSPYYWGQYGTYTSGWHQPGWVHATNAGSWQNPWPAASYKQNTPPPPWSFGVGTTNNTSCTLGTQDILQGAPPLGAAAIAAVAAQAHDTSATVVSTSSTTLDAVVATYGAGVTPDRVYNTQPVTLTILHGNFTANLPPGDTATPLVQQTLFVATDAVGRVVLWGLRPPDGPFSEPGRVARPGVNHRRA